MAGSTTGSIGTIHVPAYTFSAATKKTLRVWPVVEPDVPGCLEARLGSSQKNSTKTSSSTVLILEFTRLMEIVTLTLDICRAEWVHTLDTKICHHICRVTKLSLAFIAFSNAMAPASGLPCPTCSMSFCKRYPNGVPGWDQDQASISMCSSICIFRNVKFSCRVLYLCLSIYLACIKLISWLQSGAGLAQVVWAATLSNLHAF